MKLKNVMDDSLQAKGLLIPQRSHTTEKVRVVKYFSFMGKRCIDEITQKLKFIQQV